MFQKLKMIQSTSKIKQQQQFVQRSTVLNGIQYLLLMVTDLHLIF